MPHRDVAKFKTNLFWNLMFLDVFVLGLRWGGLAVVDFVIHGGLLLLATIALAFHRRLHAPPRWFYLVFGVLVGISLVQLIPLPQALFPILAPVKARLAETIDGIFPEIPISTQITLMPSFHIFKLAIFAMDIYAIALMMMAPTPGRRVWQLWLVVIASVTSMLAIWEAHDLIRETSPIHFYMGTYGALVNQNHWACFAVVMLLPLMALTVHYLRRAIKVFGRKPVDTQEMTTAMMWFALFGGALLLTFVGFHYSYSRSGIMDLVLGTICFVGLLLFRSGDGSKLSARLGLVGVGLLLLLLFPVGMGMQKFADRGVTNAKRFGYLKIGLGYLAEKPVLGLGLGSTEGTLSQTDRKGPYRTTNVREYHNDFLQTVVELGPLAFLVVLIMIWKLGHLAWERLVEPRFIDRATAAAMMGMIVMLCFHSLTSFPLRITSIRLLVSLLLILLLKDRYEERTLRRGTILAFAPLLLLSLAYVVQMVPEALTAPDQESIRGERAVKYGRFFREPMYQASEQLEVLFKGNPPIEVTLARIPQIRKLVLEHLSQQPYSLKGLNQLFMLETLERRIGDALARSEAGLDPSTYDREIFEDLKRKAAALYALGEGANVHAESAYLFLYATYEPFLDDEERAYFENLKESWKYTWNPMKRRILD